MPPKWVLAKIPSLAAKNKAQSAPKAPMKTFASKVAASKRTRDEPARAPPAKKAKGAGGRSVDSRVNISGLKVIEDCTVKLNQTHIDANNNKFYIIQALEGGGKFYAWNRWGRVGEDGANKLLPCATREKAIQEFEKKFREKTSNAWQNRANFKTVSGKYTIVETDDSGGGADKAPMGKLTEAQIEKGQKVLEKLKKAIKGGGAKVIDELSSEFYTLIPTDVGRRRPPPINTAAALDAKEELLKFYLRMGFDKIETKAGLTPISGVMQLPVPASLGQACTGICSASAVKESENRGKELAKKQAGKPKSKMGPEHYGAIHLYTSNAIYATINKILREENRAKITKYFKYLRLFFDAAGKLPQQKRKLWRGISADLKSNTQYEKGKTVTWWSISSCTTSKAVADGFAGGCGGGCTVFTVNSKTAFDVDALSAFQGEKESILCPGTTFKVLSKVVKGGVTYIEMDESGRSID
mmetsp:Transcript_93783/g.148082  ORF Transcript_93783/g.148082 Transcript_93783/m.148082 type:complete len:469 (+) Transcript_93783:75-1481(+)